MANEDMEEEKEIDLLEIAKKLWVRRKTIIIWCCVGAVLGLIIAFSIPREYTTEVTLAPEISDNTGKSGMNTLASFAGINLNNNGADAVYPELYPDVVQSVPFCLSLMQTPLTNKEGDRKFTLEEYMEDDMKYPWWSVILSLPGKALSIFKSEDEDINPLDSTLKVIKLSEEQAELIKSLNTLVVANVDKKTFVVTISVTMQDPMVSAVLADTVVNRLREFVTNYRTNKARQDLIYAEKLNKEAKEAYYAAQQKYANYLDTHQGVVMYSAQTVRDRLENEATLAFNLYNQTSHQLQMAKAKVQQETPVYATISPATVPIKPSAPRKLLILVGFVFLAFVSSAAWILYIEPNKEKFNLKEEDKEASDEKKHISE